MFPTPFYLVLLYVFQQDLKVQSMQEPYYSASSPNHCDSNLCPTEWKGLAQRMERNEVAQMGGRTYSGSQGWAGEANIVVHLYDRPFFPSEIFAVDVLHSP